LSTSSNDFTKTEQAILSKLRDGRRHSADELRTCLPDEMAGVECLRQHIFNIRRKLKARGHLIICDVERKIDVSYHLRREVGQYDE